MSVSPYARINGHVSSFCFEWKSLNLIAMGCASMLWRSLQFEAGARLAYGVRIQLKGTDGPFSACIQWCWKGVRCSKRSIPFQSDAQQVDPANRLLLRRPRVLLCPMIRLLGAAHAECAGGVFAQGGPRRDRFA